MENIPAFKALRRRHVKTWIFKFWQKVDKAGPVPGHAPELGPCWVWTGARHYRGYGHVQVWSTIQFAHRASWFLAHGVWPAGLEVRHRCDNPPCVNPEHLETGTHQENMDDRARRGRDGGPKRAGERNCNAKLTADDVRRIRSLYAAGLNPKRIAALYRMDASSIADVCARRTWKHVA